MRESHPAVAKILPSERTEIDCWPECFVLTTLAAGAADVGPDTGRWCLAMMASAPEVRKYGAVSGDGETDSESTIPRYLSVARHNR